MPARFLPEQLIKIRASFLFDHPFLSVLALSLDHVIRTDMKHSIETDGFRIFVHPEKASESEDALLTYRYAHCLLHIALRHGTRGEGKDLKLWNRCADVSVNNLLDDMHNTGERPQEEYYNPSYRDRTAEEIYRLLETGEGQDESELQTESESGAGIQDLHNPEDPSKRSDDKQTSAFDLIAEEEKLLALVEQAKSAASKSSLPAGLLYEIEKATQVQLPVEDLLRDYVTRSFHEKQMNFSRPSRRFIHQGLYLPGLVPTHERLNAILALDASGSIPEQAYEDLVGTMQRILGGFMEKQLLIVPFDEQVLEDQVLEVDTFGTYAEHPVLPPRTKGGTSFQSVIQWILKKGHPTGDTLLVVLTDGLFEKPSHVPLETVFILTDHRQRESLLPLGRVILL